MLTIGVTIRLAARLVVPSVAYNFTSVGTCKAAPPTTAEKVALVCPAGIVTGAGAVNSVGSNDSKGDGHSAGRCRSCQARLYR